MAQVLLFVVPTPTSTNPQMNNKKRSMMAFLAMLSVAPSLLANQVRTVGGSGYGPYQSGVGGEFTLRLGDGTGGGGSAPLSGLQSGQSNPVSGVNWTGSGVNSIFSLYSPLARNQDALAGDMNNFQTFCVEGAEYIYSYNTSDVTVGQKTIYTGTELTLGAAWLYGMFATGQLAGYNYGPGLNPTAPQIAARKASAGLLQDTIWALMGQEGKTQANIGDDFENLVIGKFGSWGNALFANGSTYGVSVLNLWGVGQVNTGGGKQQDQLILTSKTGFSVPDGGSTVAFLGMSITGLVALRRKFQASN